MDASVIAPVSVTFEELGLGPDLLAGLAELGFVTPTPIQVAAIPPLLAGRDLLGQAQTGTGKTAAFALPLLQRLDDRPGVQAIVLTPTRELALQVAEAVESYGRRLGRRGARVLAVYGGQAIQPQLAGLRRGVQVVVGTPGRVRDHLERGSLDLSSVQFFGLDEADEMLAMGFLDDVEHILGHAPPERQIALFSATLPREVRRVADAHLRDPVDVTISRNDPGGARIEQLAVRVAHRGAKDAAVARLLEAEEAEAALVFAATREACESLAERLQQDGLDVEHVHGGLSQAQREAVVARLRSGRARAVVATDVAARGLDVDRIGLVINYDLPRDDEVYVHRIGRTGRAGRVGRAILLWTPREGRRLAALERLTGGRIEPLHLPTPAELVARRRARFAARVRELAGEPGAADQPGLDPAFVDLARELAGGLAGGAGAPERDAALERVAAAALRLAWGEGPLVLAERPGRRAQRERDEREGPGRDAAPWASGEGPARERGPRRPRQHDEERGDDEAREAAHDVPPWRRGQDDGEGEPEAGRRGRPGARGRSLVRPAGRAEVELVLSLGARDRLEPGGVVGMIAGESGLPGSVVGAIRIHDRVTFVAVAAEHADAILEALNQAKHRGRALSARLAAEDGGLAAEDRPGRPPQRRDGGPSRPRPRGRAAEDLPPGDRPPWEDRRGHARGAGRPAGRHGGRSRPR